MIDKKQRREHTHCNMGIPATARLNSDVRLVWRADGLSEDLLTSRHEPLETDIAKSIEKSIFLQNSDYNEKMR